MTNTVKAVVMAGGRGERFWPASTPDRPKQFIDLTGGGTLIQQTVNRLAQIIPFRDIFVVTAASHVDLAQTQLPQLPRRNFIVEPVGRDTAPCVGLASIWLEKFDPEATVLVVAADHFIPDQERFCDIAQAGINFAAKSGGLVTFGIKPTRPETGYGYIELGELSSYSETEPVHRARRFVEKPNAAIAADYMASGRFLWNAGMFVWSLRAIREEIERHLPELHNGLEELACCPTVEELQAKLPEHFPRLPKISIDFGVMERSDRVFVIPSDFRWDDLGSWTALARLRTPDRDGNVVKGLVLTEDCRNVMVEANGGRLVAALGVSDIIVVETEHAVLVCAADRTQDIRRLALKAQETATAAREPEPLKAV
ncbi:MAG TPA: mannose-1-phosphate guanylyltransferase [Symbiobacteriaceae bacterium]|nr:mannose-1-phosphate guanylyltransferase [Symbiobacteriaceae bacterium]